jgi:hypothetical protein
MAGRLRLTLRQYQALEAGELHITNDLYERIVDLCGWRDRPHLARLQHGPSPTFVAPRGATLRPTRAFS